MKTVNLECGGKNALIVFADADLERAAQAALLSAFVNAGQLCVSCSRLLVQKSVAAKFTALLLEKAKRIKVGDSRDPKTLVGPMITRAQYEATLAAIARAVSEGCKVLCGGGIRFRSTGWMGAMRAVAIRHSFIPGSTFFGRCFSFNRV